VGITVSSKEVSGRKGLRQENGINNNKNKIIIIITPPTTIITILLLFFLLLLLFIFLFLHKSNLHGFLLFCTRSFHAFLSLMGWLHFLSFSFSKSFITSSLRPYFGCPLVLASIGF